MEIRSVNSATAPGAVKGSEVKTPPAANPDKPVVAAGAPVTEAAAQAAPVDQEALQRELDESVKKVNDTVHLFNSSVQFAVDEETKRQVIKVVDLDSDQVIRQIPSEDILAIARAFDKLQGILIKDKA